MEGKLQLCTITNFKKKLNMKRKGFSLIELLVVFIIIGVFVGSMLLVFGRASDSARVASLLSDLRNAKAAGVLWMFLNINSSDAELAVAWSGNVVAMRNAFEVYLDNSTKVQQLLFSTSSEAGAATFLVGRSEDASVLDRAIRQNPGVLFAADGETPSVTDGRVFMRVSR